MQYLTDNYYDFWCKDVRDKIKLLGNGVPLWYDEYNCLHKALNGYYTDPMHGVRYAMGTIALMNAGVENALVWSVADQQWPNNHTNNNDSFTDGVQHCGVIPMLNKTLVPRPSFYAIQMLANFFGGKGTKVYAEQSGATRLHSVLTEQPDGNITVAVVSMREKQTKFSLDIGAEEKRTLYRYVYNSKEIVPDEMAEMLASDKFIKVQGSVISDTILPNSILIYTTIQK